MLKLMVQRGANRRYRCEHQCATKTNPKLMKKMQELDIHQMTWHVYDTCKNSEIYIDANRRGMLQRFREDEYPGINFI